MLVKSSLFPVSARPTSARGFSLNCPAHHRATRARPRFAAELLLALSLGSALWGAGNGSPALSPAEALKSFQVEPGAQIELIAAEPLVVSPVAFAFDEKGRLYVVENRGYPDTEGAITTEGRVALLEDTDGDGRYDKRTEFATGLTYPNGICLWRGGMFVTCAPDIYYLKDNTGSGVADEKRVVLTGYSNTKTAQIRTSHPTLGLDGKIYVTSGLNSGKVASPEHPERPAVEFAVSDSRFDPETFVVETTGGRGQFGLAMDDFGRRFDCSNRSPFVGVMLEPWQLKRNPNLAFSAMTQEVSKIDYEAKVSPISRTAVTAAYIPSLMNAPHTGTFTSACGITVYRGTALGGDTYGNAFICEPAQNLVQRQIIRPEGASFRSDVPHPEREFLASTDGWFRPVFSGNGPQGALYIADMYRREIDHPQYVPEETRKTLDFFSGRDRGRLYRITKEGVTKTVFRPLDITTRGLVALLNAADGWERDTAYRLLLEKKDPAAIPLLAALAGNASRAEARARALWLLRDFGKLDLPLAERALTDVDPRVRENALQLVGEIAVKSPQAAAAVVALAKDGDVRVRFECALQLSALRGNAALAGLVEIAARDGADRWTRAAVLSGLATEFPTFFQHFRERIDSSPVAYAAVMNDLGQLFGAAGTPEACRQMLIDTIMARDAAGLPSRLSAVLGLADGLKARKKTRGGTASILTGLIGTGHDADGAQAKALSDFFSAAGMLALDAKQPLADRITATTLLGYADYERYAATLGRLLQGDNSTDLQLAAVHAIDRIGDLRGAALLVNGKRWAAFTPRVREAVLAALSADAKRIEVLFTAIETKIVPATDVSSLRRSQLLKHKDDAVRKRAEAVFHDLEGGDRMQAYQAMRGVLALSSDAVHGHDVFAKICSVCHSYGGAGGHIGPELTAIHNQPAEAILLHIIVPNYEIAAGYQTFTLETKDGRTLSGWLVGETEASVLLRTVTEGDTTVLRSNIRSLTAASVSLMPDGLEKTMSQQELADLIAYLKTGK